MRRTCAIDLACVLCVDCFRAADHEGHEVLFGQAFSFAPSCDCGNPTVWHDDAHLGCANHPRLPLGTMAPLHPDTTNDPKIPSALIKAVYETIVICLEFTIQVLQHSQRPQEHGDLPKDEASMRLPESVTGEAREKRGKGPWSVILWADEKHVAKEVTRQVRDALGVRWETAEGYVREVEEMVSIPVNTTAHR